MIFDVMFGMCIFSFICLLVISILYFRENRLNNLSTKFFGGIVNLTVLIVLFDMLSYLIGTGYISYDKFFSNTITYLFSMASIYVLHLLTDYCYLMTYGRTRAISWVFLTVTILPVAISAILLILVWSFSGLVYMADGSLNLSIYVFWIIVACYGVYTLINFVLMVVHKDEAVYKFNKVSATITLLQGIFMICFALLTSVFVESIILTLDVMILFITVQYPKNNRDHHLDCFDPKALAIMFEDYEARKCNYYMFTIDIVNFNYYVAKYGIDFSEQILHKLKISLPRDSRDTSLFHYESDIFVVLTTNFEKYQELLNYFEKNLSQEWFLNGVKLDIELMVTHYYKDFSVDDENMNIFIERMLNFEKRHSRKDIIFVNERKELMNREYLVQKAVINAIQNNSFMIFLQPIYNVKKGRYDKAEVLVRLEDNTLGFVSPAEFIEMAEKKGLISDITKQVITKAITEMKKNDFVGKGVDNISINLSSLEVGGSQIFNFIHNTLEIFQLDPSKITLEITETAEFANHVNLNSIVSRYKEHGYKIALDDFGTGYSNIDRILSIPFDFIKLDKTMLTSENSNKRILLEKNIEMLKECGYQIIVEGVEKEDMVEFLKERKVDYIQGYYYSRPLSVENFVKFIEANN